MEKKKQKSRRNYNNTYYCKKEEGEIGYIPIVCDGKGWVDISRKDEGLVLVNNTNPNANI